ncbi:putative leucine-rich repeat receptor-like protein kinase [Heracleum sosnowskyi]|uniref:non-specific serine/threonine protein kinase n=1 Tax=Heracleum sosnowskyi TaxID=360622 RepID=A0AAD8IVT9_9APIA|nr:putative leucine-rich repeat receptor-like protein kinase [Heracleum sosnowskyi]
MKIVYNGLHICNGLLLSSIAASLFSSSMADFKAPSPEDSACVLNLTLFPYQPQGECIDKPRQIMEWNSFPTTICCRNALAVLGKSLALRAILDKNAKNIFIQDEQWRNCSGPFLRQSSVSIKSCGFGNLFYGSSKCSKLSLSDMTNYSVFRDAAFKCMHFGYSFDADCANCTTAISSARDHLVKKLNVVGNNTEKAICGVAVVTAIAAQQMSHSLRQVDDLYRCVSALDVYDPGYIKLKVSLVKGLSALFIATIGLIMIIVLILILYANKKKNYKCALAKEITEWSGLYRFTKKEIENAINIKNLRTCLGRGSAGTVYKGILPSGQVVAIKHIYKGFNLDTFTREVKGLSGVRHPNLVCLFGFCIEDEEQYLVYEHCSNGNLAQHLLRKDTLLTWERRVKILRDCSLGLRHLHHHIDGSIVHRNIKLTNILLTENWEPKLSDFGIAKMLGMKESKVLTEIRGTVGYMDPEYMSTSKLTRSSDIYSFGIVILQLLSAQRVIELDLDARDQLTRKAKDVIEGKRPLSDFIDHRLDENLIIVDFESILEAAVCCVARSSTARPTIDIIFSEMDKAWKNTLLGKGGKMGSSSSATPTLSSTLGVPPIQDSNLR